MSQSKADPSSPSKSNLPAAPPLVPHLTVGGGKTAIAFYERAFGAELVDHIATPDSRTLHAVLRVPNGGVFFLNDDFSEWGPAASKTPKAAGGSPVTIHLEVPDADAAWKRAIEAGAESIMPLENTFWGTRYGVLQDPFGHRWSLQTKLRDVSPEELQEAASKMFGAPCTANRK